MFVLSISCTDNTVDRADLCSDASLCCREAKLSLFTFVCSFFLYSGKIIQTTCMLFMIRSMVHEKCNFNTISEYLSTQAVCLSCFCFLVRNTNKPVDVSDTQMSNLILHCLA